MLFLERVFSWVGRGIFWGLVGPGWVDFGRKFGLGFFFGREVWLKC